MPHNQDDNWSNIDDVALAGMAANGDDKAFGEILNRYRTKILAICLKMLKNRTEAEEAAQDCFVKIYFHLKDFDRSRNFNVWAASIAVNDCRDRLRKRSRYSRTFREIVETDAPYDPAARDNDDGRDDLKAVEQALDELPEKLKEVIVLKAYNDYSYDEIAKILKIRTGTVMSRLFRARQKLTEILGRVNRVE